MELNKIEEDAIKLSIEEARKCKPEDNRSHPLVGVVVVKNNEIISSAYRGEKARGDHAEFTLTEKKLKEDLLTGCEIFTTLEPCTTRNHPKIPCAERLIERKVRKVWIGMVDPNPEITGKGILKLRDANIEVAYYPHPYSDIIEELNREFTRFQKNKHQKISIDVGTLDQLSRRSLDDWYVCVNRIYWNRNYFKDVSLVFSHLIEVIGGLSHLASEKKKENVNPPEYLPKAIAWWLALCGKLGINSVEEMLWDKFPNVCPYCQEIPHNQRLCTEKKATGTGPDWANLKRLGKEKKRPRTLGEWQLMFESIYRVTGEDDYRPILARLVEELGELSESVRVFPAEPGYFLSEACDVFAWLMRIQNILDYKSHNKFGETLNSIFAKNYPDMCLDCNQAVCSCPPFLKRTIGRIAHEVPIPKDSGERLQRFLTPDQTSEKFGY